MARNQESVTKRTIRRRKLREMAPLRSTSASSKPVTTMPVGPGPARLGVRLSHATAGRDA